MVHISREEASDIMTAEERGHQYHPKPGAGIPAGRIERIYYEEDGTECWEIRPTALPDRLHHTCGQMRRARLIQAAAKAHGVEESEIELWADHAL